MSGYALCFRQLMARDLARQQRVQGLAPALLALVRTDLNVLFWRALLRRFALSRQSLRFVPEQVALVALVCLALRAKQLTLKRLQLLAQYCSIALSCALSQVSTSKVGGHHRGYVTCSEQGCP
jgi:hypothetical protein